jgi:hypothetical protein
MDISNGDCEEESCVEVAQDLVQWRSFALIGFTLT